MKPEETELNLFLDSTTIQWSGGGSETCEENQTSN